MILSMTKLYWTIYPSVYIHCIGLLNFTSDKVEERLNKKVAKQWKRICLYLHESMWEFSFHNNISCEYSSLQ